MSLQVFAWIEHLNAEQALVESVLQAVFPHFCEKLQYFCKKRFLAAFVELQGFQYEHCYKCCLRTRISQAS